MKSFCDMLSGMNSFGSSNAWSQEIGSSASKPFKTIQQPVYQDWDCWSEFGARFTAVLNLGQTKSNPHNLSILCWNLSSTGASWFATPLTSPRCNLPLQSSVPLSISLSLSLSPGLSHCLSLPFSDHHLFFLPHPFHPRSAWEAPCCEHLATAGPGQLCQASRLSMRLNTSKKYKQSFRIYTKYKFDQICLYMPIPTPWPRVLSLCKWPCLLLDFGLFNLFASPKAEAKRNLRRKNDVLNMWHDVDVTSKNWTAAFCSSIFLLHPLWHHSRKAVCSIVQQSKSCTFLQMFEAQHVYVSCFSIATKVYDKYTSQTRMPK